MNEKYSKIMKPQVIDDILDDFQLKYNLISVDISGKKKENKDKNAFDSIFKFI